MFKKYIILRGPAVSMEFYKVIERMLGEGKKLESLELVRHILYDLAYVSKPKTTAHLSHKHFPGYWKVRRRKFWKKNEYF